MRSSNTNCDLNAFTIEGPPDQVIGFPALIYMITLVMSFIPLTLLLATQKHQHIPGGTVYKAKLLSSIMIEQTIIQAALASIEMIDGMKGKFKVWVESIKMQHKYQVKIQFT